VTARHIFLATDDALPGIVGNKHGGAAGAHAGVESKDIHSALDEAGNLVEAEARQAR
jgi:hypothetical protein